MHEQNSASVQPYVQAKEPAGVKGTDTTAAEARQLVVEYGRLVYDTRPDSWADRAIKLLRRIGGDGVAPTAEVLPVCAGCGQPIPDDRWVRDEGRMWHARCHPESRHRNAGVPPTHGGER